MQFLRQATASQLVLLGPLAKSTDGTAQTGQTIANTDIKLRFNAGTAFVSKNSGGGTEISAGCYYCTLDATDTATLGRLDMVMALTSTLVWRQSFMVLAPAVYDAMVGTDQSILGVLNVGTAAAIANGTITLQSGHGLTNLAAALVVLTGGTNAKGKSRIITYSGAGDVFNVDPAWNTNGETTPSGTITYIVTALPLAAASQPIPADVQKWFGTAVPGVDTNGYPRVTVKTGAGAGEINLTSGVVQADIKQIADVPISGDGTSGNKFHV